MLELPALAEGIDLTSLHTLAGVLLGSTTAAEVGRRT
jgi:hypothetical protein